MCQQQINAQTPQQQEQHKMKSSTTYTIKKVLKTFFKKQQKSTTGNASDVTSTTSCSSCEDFENLRNMQTEQQQFYTEIDDNMVNEKLADMSMEIEEEEEEADVYVPVRFARTEAGTFFWTTNLQPVTNTIIPAADEDLLQPAYCYSNYQYPLMQFQDRWAQA